jgi:hypothetical protein
MSEYSKRLEGVIASYGLLLSIIYFSLYAVAFGAYFLSGRIVWPLIVLALMIAIEVCRLLHCAPHLGNATIASPSITRLATPAIKSGFVAAGVAVSIVAVVQCLTFVLSWIGLGV